MRMRSLSGNLVFFILFSAFILFFFRDLIFMKSALLAGDNFSQSYPWLKVYCDSVKGMHFPFWTPSIECGFPLMGEGQMGGLYPLNMVLFYALPFIAAYNLSVVLHFFIAGLAIYFFVLKKGGDSWGAGLSAFVFCAGGAFANSGYHISMVRALVWFPVVLLFFEHYLERRDQKWLVAAAVVFGFQLLAGSVQMAFYSSFFYLLYFIHIAGVCRLDAKKTGMALAVFLFIGACFFLPQYMLTRTVVANSGRIFTLDFALWGSMNPLSVITPVFPGFSGIKGYLSTEDIFLGALTVIFIARGFVACRNKPELRPFAVMFIVSVLLAFGRLNPIYALLVKYTGFYTFRMPARFIFFGIFALSVLAGVGFTEYFGKDSAKRRAAGSAFLIFVLFSTVLVAIFKYVMVFLKNSIDAAGSFFVNSFILGRSHHRYAPAYYYEKVKAVLLNINKGLSCQNMNFVLSVIFILAGILFLSYSVRSLEKRKAEPGSSAGLRSMAIALIFFNLLAYSYSVHGLHNNVKNIAVAEKPEAAEILRHIKADSGIFRVYPYDIRSGKLPAWTQPNFNMCYGVDSIGGYSPLSGKSYKKYTDIFQVVDDSVGLLYPDKAALGPEAIDRLRTLNVKYVVSPYEIKAEGLDFVLESDDIFLYSVRAYLERCFFVRDLAGMPEQGDAAPKVVSYGPGYAEFEASPDAEGFLVFSENFSQGWEAYEDGKNIEILRFRDVLQAVPVGKGTHKIVFKYRPFAF